MNHFHLNFKIQKTQIFDVLTSSMIDFIYIHRYHLLNQESTRSVGMNITAILIKMMISEYSIFN